MDKKTYEFISKQTKDSIVERKVCKWTGEEFPVFQKEHDFYQKHGLDMPQISPDSRMRALMFTRSEMEFYRRNSDKSGEKTMSLLSPDYKGKVYAHKEWWDEGGFFDIDEEYNPGSFLEQLLKLKLRVPQPAINIFWSNENVHYCNRYGNLRDAYYSFVVFGSSSQDIYFSHSIDTCKDIYYSFFVRNSEVIWNSSLIGNSFGIYNSKIIKNCHNSYFCYDMKDCQNCMFSYNQVGKQYMIKNKQYTKESYQKHKEKMLSMLKTSSGYQKLLKQYEDIKSKAIRKSVDNINTEKSVGTGLKNAKNAHFCFDMIELDSAYNSRVGFPGPMKNIFNSYGFGVVENLHQSLGVGPGNKIFFCRNIENCNDIYYSFECKNCDFCIGCSGLQDKKYCILNKQYEQEDRLIKFEQIKKELQQKNLWSNIYEGVSEFPYNDTLSMLDFPLHKVIYPDGKHEILNEDGHGTIEILEENKFISDATLDLGGDIKINTKRRTKEQDINIPKGIEILEDLPDSIQDIEDTIVEKAIKCKQTGRPYRVIKRELDFYRKNNLPFIQLHPKLRIVEKYQSKPLRTLHLRTCDKCNKEMLSVYPQDSKFKVYCEVCYDKEIY